ncbi:uncharacterized protein LOC106955263 [Poecilia latipinna]|uniref:uncharacterized protein LOC106955263 n=1 Tax=Poecilia latipinna TaxID=48699 RepID=UPI00072DE765|nr:PREDICTED: uncharacterized protein LOC106955263 [Poecilia latipinna]
MESSQPTCNPCSNEVQTFLSITEDCNIQHQLDEATGNENVFVEVAERMTGAGYHRTSQQCWEKVEKLKTDYKNMKDDNGQRGSNQNWRQRFDLMDDIHGHRPASCGEDESVDSDTSLLEDICNGSLPCGAETETDADDFPSFLSDPSSSSTSTSSDAPPSAGWTPLPSSQRRRSSQRCRSGKRRRSGGVSDVNEEVENRQQRERHHSSWMEILREEAAIRREEAATNRQMVALRREELRQASHFYTACLGLLGDMVAILRERQDGQHSTVNVDNDAKENADI